MGAVVSLCRWSSKINDSTQKTYLTLNADVDARYAKESGWELKDEGTAHLFKNWKITAGSNIQRHQHRLVMHHSHSWPLEHHLLLPTVWGTFEGRPIKQTFQIQSRQWGARARARISWPSLTVRNLLCVQHVPQWAILCVGASLQTYRPQSQCRTSDPIQIAVWRFTVDN